MKVLHFAPLALAMLLVGACSSSGPHDSPKGQISFGAQMAQRGLWNEALFRFRQAERMEAANPRVWNNLAVAYEATGDYDAALKAYRKALELAPGDLDIKRNYSRFVEFYQSFKPKSDAKDQPATAAPASSSEKPPGARRSA